jgi:hypothetical protein
MEQGTDHAYTQRSVEPPGVSGEKEINMANQGKKCAHPVCSGIVTSGKYCSTQCEAMEKTPDIDCTCEHPACQDRTER